MLKIEKVEVQMKGRTRFLYKKVLEDVLEPEYKTRIHFLPSDSLTIKELTEGPVVTEQRLRKLLPQVYQSVGIYGNTRATVAEGTTFVLKHQVGHDIYVSITAE